MKSIIDFFDPHDIEHIRAWRILEKKGFWPKGFLPKEIEFPKMWQIDVYNKIAQCWLVHMEECEKDKGEAFFNDR